MLLKRNILPLLLAFCCLLSPAQDAVDHDSYFDTYYKFLDASDVNHAQKIYLSEEVKQLSIQEQYELLIDQYADGEQLDIIQAIIDKQIKLNLSQEKQKSTIAAFEEDGGNTPLEAILSNSNLDYRTRIDFAEQLLLQGYTMSNKALCLCCEDGELELIKFCIAKGAKLEAKNEEGYTVLHQAIIGNADNKTKIIKHLLKHGANINAHGPNGTTPLILACYNGYIDLIHLLIEEGADLEAKDNDGCTALHNLCYVEYGNELECIKILLEHGADINALDVDQTTPLLLSCYLGRSDLAQCLISHGANANQIIDDAPPLIAAIAGAIIHKNWDIIPLIWQQQNLKSIAIAGIVFFQIIVLILSPFIVLTLVIIQKRRARKRKLSTPDKA